LRHDYALRYAGGKDREATFKEWKGFWSCDLHNQPKAYFAYAWLQEAERFGGKGHVTMTDERVAGWIADNWHLDYDTELGYLHALQKDNMRNDEGELWFWAVYGSKLV
jgi:hypothetical protein